MAWLWLAHLLFAEAHPRPIDDGALQNPHNLDTRGNENRTIHSEEPPSDRTLYTVLALFCMMVLSLMLGSRFKKLRKNALMRRNITAMLVLVLYVLVMSFILCSAVMLAGQGLYTYNLCFSATWICLILYTASKLVIYVFLVERVHVIRAPFVRRSRDWLYLSAVVITIISFAGVAINAYVHPIIELDSQDGRCQMGISGKVSLPFMTVDIAIDVALTAVFLYLLRPLVHLNGISTVLGVTRTKASTATVDMEETPVQRNIRHLLYKSLIGSMLIMLPTVANMIQFYITKGHELAIVCLTVCTMDVAWDVVVLHWLTFGSAKAERNLTRAAESLTEVAGNGMGRSTPSRASTARPSSGSPGLGNGPGANVVVRMKEPEKALQGMQWQERSASGDSTAPFNAI